MMKRENILLGMMIIGVILFLWISFNRPFTPTQIKTVNITDVWLMNSGIMIWGYWDNSTIEECIGLFQSGFSHNDIGCIYRIQFKEWPNENIRCLKLIKKIEIGEGI